MAASTSYEEHIKQNNDRLRNIKVALSNPLTFTGAARELFEWCSDKRAFQTCFKSNLMQCLQVVFGVCRVDGFDVQLSFNLIKLCYENRNSFDRDNSDLLSTWYDDLCCRWSQPSTALNNIIMHKTNMNQQQQQMLWNGGGMQTQGGPGAVSVVTTVYPGTVQSGYANQGQCSNEFDNAAYATPPAYGASKTGYGNGCMPGYAHAGAKPQQGYPASSAYNPQMRVSYGQNPAHHMAAAAAVAGATAVATATATAVAFDPSQMQARNSQYSQTQQGMHPQHAYHQSAQSYPGYQRSPMPPYPQQEGVRYMSQGNIPPQHRMMHVPQGYSPIIRQHMTPQQQASMMGNPRGNMYPVRSNVPQNVVPMQQRPMLDSRGYPIMPQHLVQNRMCQPMPMSKGMSQAPMDNYYDPSIDIKPQLPRRDDLVSFPVKNGVLLQDFRLDHNIMHPNMTNYNFEINQLAWEYLRNNPNADLQLKCFHNDDPTQPNNWPVNQDQISVQVSVNGTRQHFEQTGMPLYLKRFIRLGANSLEISVMQCCCSHLFSLRLVERQPVKQLVAIFEAKKALQMMEGKEKIKRFLQMQPSSNDVENLSVKVSLKDPISQGVIVTPARGRDCMHLQCFDLAMFFMFNKEKNYWHCPICNNRIHDNIEVDLYLKGIINNANTHGTHQTEVTFDAAANHTFPETKLSNVKMERIQNDTCSSGPPAKRIKTECPPTPGFMGTYPPPYPSASPQSHPAYSNLSPYMQQQNSPSQPPSLGRGPPTPRAGYQPPTPVTPGGAHQANPSSVEPPIQQQISQEGSVGSVTGSAPYTPASVSSAGGLPGVQTGPGQTAPVLGAQDLEPLSSWDIDDLFQADSRDNNQLLSEQELLKYLDQDSTFASADDAIRPPPIDSNLNPLMCNNNQTTDTCALSDEDFYSLIGGESNT